jgi:hypothetical protein
MQKMNSPEPHRQGPLKIFYEQFESHLSMDDYSQFFSNRKSAGNNTFLCSDIYTAENLSAVILEEYSIRGKLRQRIIDAIEAQAAEDKMGIITLEAFDKYKETLLDSL